jgi:hypothetical protein
MTRPDPIDEALALVAADRKQLLAELNRPRISQHHEYARTGWLHRYRWWIERTTGARFATVAYGRTVTKWGAERVAHRAYLRELNR